MGKSHIDSLQAWVTAKCSREKPIKIASVNKPLFFRSINFCQYNAVLDLLPILPPGGLRYTDTGVVAHGTSSEFVVMILVALIDLFAASLDAGSKSIIGMTFWTKSTMCLGVYHSSERELCWILLIA